MELVFLGIGLLIGVIATWITSGLYHQNKGAGDSATREIEVKNKVLLEKLRSAEDSIKTAAQQLEQKQQEIIKLSSVNSTLEANQKKPGPTNV